jgi:hypothetical protein
MDLYVTAYLEMGSSVRRKEGFVSLSRRQECILTHTLDWTGLDCYGRDTVMYGHESRGTWNEDDFAGEGQ